MAGPARLDDPGALGGVLTGASFIGGLATGLSLADAPFPRPGAAVEDIQRFFQGDAGPERINVAGQLLSAAALAVFSASVARLAGRADRGPRTLRAMAIAGGALASLSLAASATGRGGAHRRSWPGPGPGQVTAPVRVRRRGAGPWRRAGPAAGGAGAGRAAHRGPAAAADDGLLWPRPASTPWPRSCSRCPRRPWSSPPDGSPPSSCWVSAVPAFRGPGAG